MEDNSSEVKKLVEQSKKLREVSKVKQSLEHTLSELTFCNNIANLSKRLKLFSMKVLKVSCRVVASSVPSLETNQTLVITVQNVSDNLVFNCGYWQLFISMNHDRTQSTWNLDTSLGPGQSDTFCCPFNKTFPLDTISVWLKFIIQFESKTYTRSFNIQDCIVDILHCLDAGRNLSETSTVPFTNDSFVDFCTNDESKVSFPPVTKFMLKLDGSLKERFIEDILVRDSMHRGFSDCIKEFTSQNEMSVFYLGNKIDVNLSHKGDNIAIKCMNPIVLCSVKASILRRLVTVEGVTVYGLDDENIEKVHNIGFKLNAFEMDCNPDSVDVSDLIALYLELRDISESIRFSVVHLVE